MRVIPSVRYLFSDNPSFAGHQTFALRWGWLKKALDALQNEEVGGKDLFAREANLLL
ncbi:MAG: DUF4007 family protein [Chloroherpetonaceae bacterium]|nr:DUF4007 family protein [Chloroherpetonaceae bacterium]